MTIYIVRHGLTKENKQRVFQGHLPGELSLEGIKQAKKIAKYFKDLQIDLILSSDLKRAKDTLLEILKFHEDTPVEYLKELRERDYGIFSGKPRIRVEDSIAKKEFESKESMYERSEKLIKKIKESKAKNTLIVGHGSMNKMLITSLLGKGEEFRKNLPLMENASISFVRQEGDSFYLDIFSSLDHLKNL